MSNNSLIVISNPQRCHKYEGQKDHGGDNAEEITRVWFFHFISRIKDNQFIHNFRSLDQQKR